MKIFSSLGRRVFDISKDMKFIPKDPYEEGTYDVSEIRFKELNISLKNITPNRKPEDCKKINC